MNGRKLINLDAQDSAFQGGQVATVTGSQIQNDFALVGGFSLLDSAEKPLIDIGRHARRRLPARPRAVDRPLRLQPAPQPRQTTTPSTSSST